MLEPPTTIHLLQPDTECVIRAAIDATDATVLSNAFQISCSEEECRLDGLRNNQGTENTIDLPLNEDFKAQVRPERQPRDWKWEPPKDVVSLKKARHLERNRVAANKCRQKKKQRIEETQRVFKAQTAKRRILVAEVNTLKEDLWQLKNRIFAHANCEDHRISLQLTKMTQKLLASSSSLRALSFVSDSTCSDRSMEEGMNTDQSTASPTTLAVDDSVAYPEETFDDFIDLPNM
ncbi:hypothetical protein N7454_003252 [Penicillium verhagenii]|nr:hypothetical protein N7454_003252 [Penicillium verhagenii]